MNRKELQNQQLQLYSYLTHPGENLKALAVRPPLNTNEGFAPAFCAFRVPHNFAPELSKLFIRSFLNGVTLFGVNYSIRKLKKRFPNRKHAIFFMGSLIENYIRYSLFSLNIATLLSSISEYEEEAGALSLISAETSALSLIATSKFNYYSSRLNYYSGLVLPAVLITSLQYGIRYCFGERSAIPVLVNLVLFLSAMALVYTSDDSDNPLQTMAEYALKFLYSMCVELVLTYYEKNRTEILLKAIWHNDQALVRLFLAVGANVNATNRNGETLLHIAVRRNHQKIMLELLTSGANVNAESVVGLLTPLHFAVFHNRQEIIGPLLVAGANVNATNRNGETPLHIAVRRNHQKIMLELLTSGANVNAESVAGLLTPLHFAVLYNRQEMIGPLLVAGANVNAIGEHGTPFHLLTSPHILLGTKEVLIKMTVLKNQIMAKPNVVETNRELSNIWNACIAEIERLRSKGSDCLSLWSFFIEKNINKLASMSKNEEIQKRSNETNFLEKYPYFGGQFQVILERSKHRDKTLTTALNSIYTYNENAGLNKFLWENILEYLDEESLRNTTRVSSLFFKTEPSNSKLYKNSYNDFSAHLK